MFMSFVTPQEVLPRPLDDLVGGLYIIWYMVTHWND